MKMSADFTLLCSIVLEAGETLLAKGERQDPKRAAYFVYRILSRPDVVGTGYRGMLLAAGRRPREQRTGSLRFRVARSCVACLSPLTRHFRGAACDNCVFCVWHEWTSTSSRHLMTFPFPLSRGTDVGSVTG